MWTITINGKKQDEAIYLVDETRLDLAHHCHLALKATPYYKKSGSPEIREVSPVDNPDARYFYFTATKGLVVQAAARYVDSSFTRVL